MHASNVALPVLATFVATSVLAAPISYVVAASGVVTPAELYLPSVRNATDASPNANLSLLGSLSDSCSQDSGASISVYKNDTVLENKRGELGPLSGSSPQKALAYNRSDDSLRRDLSGIMPSDSTLKQLAARGVLDNLSHGGALNAHKFDSHQEIKARDHVTRLMKFGVLYKRLRDASVIFGRQETNSDQLAARDIAGDVMGEFIVESVEDVDNRTHHRIQARGVPEVRTETVARDGVADDFLLF